MNLIEGVLKDYVFIDTDLDPQFGSDQMDIYYPTRFATVEFMLVTTSLLSTIADRIRKDLGFIPMGPMDEYADETCDQRGWYDFYYGANAIGEGYGDNAIEFVVAGSDSPDNEEVYSIELTPEEQDAMFERIDEECQKRYGKGIHHFLSEANQRMLDEEAEDPGPFVELGSDFEQELEDE